jgi:hypothetical protein
MCAVAVPIVMALAQTGIQLAQQQQQAKAAAQRNKAEATAAAQDFALERSNQALQQEKEAVDASNARFDNKVEVIRRQGEARARFAESGTTGGALQSVLNEFARQGGRANARVSQNLRFSNVQSDLQGQASFNNTIRNTALAARDASGPGLLDIGTAALSGASTGLSLNSQLRKPTP